MRPRRLHVPRRDDQRMSWTGSAKIHHFGKPGSPPLVQQPPSPVAVAPAVCAAACRGARPALPVQADARRPQGRSGPAADRTPRGLRRPPCRRPLREPLDGPRRPSGRNAAGPDRLERPPFDNEARHSAGDRVWITDHRQLQRTAQQRQLRCDNVYLGYRLAVYRQAEALVRLHPLIDCIAPDCRPAPAENARCEERAVPLRRTAAPHLMLGGERHSWRPHRPRWRLRPARARRAASGGACPSLPPDGP